MIIKQSTAKGFGRKGWVILILSFFSILMNAMIIYDSLNVALLPQSGLGWPMRLGLQNPSILYVFSTIAAWISVPGAIIVALGNAPGVGYAYAYMLICVLCIIAVIIATRIDDTYVGKKE